MQSKGEPHHLHRIYTHPTLSPAHQSKLSSTCFAVLAFCAVLSLVVQMRAPFSLAALCCWHVFVEPVLSIRRPVPEVRNLDILQRYPVPEALRKEVDLEKRQLCVDDDYLLSLQMYIDDSYPWCSAYLGIGQTTTTATTYVRT